MKKRVFRNILTVGLLLIYLVLGYQASFATDIDELQLYFYRGNDRYEKGKYGEAISEYNEIINRGYESGSVYFNLGNSYFKKGELGKAIVNYERAKRLNPRDRDLESNYNYALSLIKGDRGETKKSWPIRVVNACYTPFSINGIIILLSLLFIAILIVIVTGKYLGTIKKYSTIVISLLLLFFMISLLPLMQRIALTDKEGVVTSETAEAGFEPIEGATTHYTLYEGMKVEIVNSTESWYKVKREDGKAGWISRDDLEIISRLK